MSFIRILTLNRQDDAEEVFQRTCMILWQKFDQFDGENFGAWACRIAHFEMLKFRDSRIQTRILHDETIEFLAIAALPIADGLSERRAALTQCLKKLPDGDHQLIQQRYYDGLSVQEISDRLGRSTHAVYRELSRIHGLLSRCIERSLTEACS
ncbi:RNA polymerase sigma factor [Neorhodopirellula pilleata]|uniref:RNA polymerase sigma factor n=2 Tax=Neorhodopirellula pilleata TaxID=2714738 RepID=A0A5C6ADT2_9BACT|nr:RNA polymerase sigma factor [Neorhodopirellula pilleata]